LVLGVCTTGHGVVPGLRIPGTALSGSLRRFLLVK
jgi:hypothetical protein